MPRATTNGTTDRRTQPRDADANWRTSITQIEPNKILIRGYPVDELMGRLNFGEAIYLMLMGELPTPSIGRLMSAVLVSSLDHGVTPPSTLAARNVATTGAPIRASVASGILALGPFHGGDITSCMKFLDSGLSLVRGGESMKAAAEKIVAHTLETHEAPPGFGHRFHTRDPRAARMFQMALELELEGEHIHMIRAVERVLESRPQPHPPMPVNVDGAIAAVCGDLGFDYELGNALFMIARLPGLVAHVHEERVRQKPMRQIDPKDHVYDGPLERRLPETRK
jgi:citrate synthase